MEDQRREKRINIQEPVEITSNAGKMRIRKRSGEKVKQHNMKLNKKDFRF